MRVRIHRGAHEIGGNCVEVEAQGHRLVLDVGKPLDTERGEVVPLPEIAGFSEPDDGLSGVVITHAHQDHWGLAGQLPAGTPLYIGEATSRILAEADYWTSGVVLDPAGFLAHREPFEAGPFRITPYLNDHSAFDAYSVLVEADGKRLFYTGDIRGHGRKSGIFEELLRKPPSDVDVLLMEGTQIGPEAIGDGGLQTESELEEQMAATFKATPGLVLAMYSAQNIDRLVTVYRAALRSDRDLVVDLYGASIAEATGNPNIPRPGPDWPRVHVFVPRSQRVKVKETKAFHRVDAIKPARVFEDELAANPSHYVMSFSHQSGSLLAKAGALAGAAAIWSMWSGYLGEPSGERLQAFLTANAVPLHIQHTSGHASVPDLQRLASAIGAGRIVPIHSFGSQRFADLFDDVVPATDGEWWDV